MGASPNNSMTMEVVMLHIIGEPYYCIEDSNATPGAGPSLPLKRQGSQALDLLSPSPKKRPVSRKQADVMDE